MGKHSQSILNLRRTESYLREYAETKEKFLKYWENGAPVGVSLEEMKNQIRRVETPIGLRPTLDMINKFGWEKAWQILQTWQLKKGFLKN